MLNWKKKFLDKASIVFDDSREENIREKLDEERKEKEAYAKKGWPAHHAGGLVEKNLKKCLDLTTRVNLLRSLLTTKSNTCRDRPIELPSIHDAAHLLGINRTSVYYAHKVYEPSEDELTCKRIIDHVHTDNPAWGARQHPHSQRRFSIYRHHEQINTANRAGKNIKCENSNPRPYNAQRDGESPPVLKQSFDVTPHKLRTSQTRHSLHIHSLSKQAATPTQQRQNCQAPTPS